VVHSSLPLELRLVLFPLRRGTGDPTVRQDPDGTWWRATRTPEGPATLRLARGGPSQVAVQAWGPGARWAVAAAPELVGARDRLDGFAPAGLVGELHRRHPGLRMPRSLAVFEAIVPSILEQKVVGVEARSAWRGLVRALAEPAPGPGRLLLPPEPAALRAHPGWAFHRLGVELKRANTVRMAATYGRRLDALVELEAGEARRRLELLPGVGPWTAAMVAAVALGDADAVPVGDIHLPHMVAWALAGEPRGSDERMLELLAPYPGHRGRVLRLLAMSGLAAPRRGPRMPLRRIQRH
jgi:3-methyladenine DNA glycosylase/8-oxoguanine DNA glycosylase